jgi:hypothetical protein
LPDVEVEIYGLPELRRKLKNDRLMGGPVKTFFKAAVALVKPRARQNAPVGDTGRLQKSITSRISGSAIPKMAKITTNAMNPKNSVRYPWVLQVGHRKQVILHYRSSGAPTKNWFESALTATAGRIYGPLMNALRGDIEALWRR